MHATLAELAAHFGLHRSTVAKQLGRSGIRAQKWLGSYVYDLSDFTAPTSWDPDHMASEHNGMVTSHEVGERLGVESHVFVNWAKSVYLKPRGSLGRLKLWSWVEVEEAGEEHGYPEAAQVLLRYVCKVCKRPRSGHFVPDACQQCVRHSLFTTTRVGSGFREEPTRCVVCNEPTKHRKPWCSDHIEHSPYVKWLLGRLNTRA